METATEIENKISEYGYIEMPAEAWSSLCKYHGEDFRFVIGDVQDFNQRFRKNRIKLVTTDIGLDGDHNYITTLELHHSVICAVHGKVNKHMICRLRHIIEGIIIGFRECGKSENTKPL
jgi:hypothetical protein